MKKIIASLTALSLLAACASPVSVQQLTGAQQDFADTQAACQQGIQAACADLPMKGAVVQQWQAQVANEQATGAAVGLGILAVGLGVAAGVAASNNNCCHDNGGWHNRSSGWHNNSNGWNNTRGGWRR